MPQIITAALFIACFFLFVRRRASVEKSAKAQNFVCLMTGVFSLLFVLFILDGGNNWGGDFSEYIAQARAIVTGTIDVQVRNNAYIIENSPPFLGDVVYPWGFPFLLAPFYALFGKNLFFLKLPVLLCFFFSVLRQTPPTARIIFFKPRVLYLETGRLGFQTSSIRRLRDADYLVLCRDGYGTFSYDIESQYPAESARLNLAFENSTFKLYEIPPDSRAELEQIWYNAGDQETP